MARQLRVEFERAFYHTTSRGNLRENVFFEDKDREKFLEILQKAKERYGYILHAYALMDNHYHLLIEMPKANISQIMHNINTSYTVYIKKKYRRNRHLFQGRFKGIIEDKDEYLITLSRYIHLNPVTAKKGQMPEDYRWTSYRAYIGKSTKDSLVDTSDTLSCYSKTRTDAIDRYKAFVKTEIRVEENSFKDIEARIILGGRRFKSKIMKLLEKIRVDDELPQIKRLRGQVPIDRVIKACCSFYDRKEVDLLKRGKGKRERQIAIYLSKILSGKKNVEVGSFFGIKGPAVCGVMKVIEERLDKEKKLKKEIECLKENLINE